MGRCANRIEGASFTLDGEIYKLAANNGKNALHGGTKGFDKHIWDAKRIDHADGDAVQLTRTSPDGEEVCIKPGSTVSVSCSSLVTHTRWYPRKHSYASTQYAAMRMTPC